ncbi:MAG TPA: PIN domain-containing protein [Acidimicrobiales bacterium]|nr:PIN domain-containing protein [Acidimicrobiales bacterium]
MFVVLDSGPLGLLSNPSSSVAAEAANRWARATIDRHQIVVPEIADYEVRRELVRAERAEGLRRLDALATGFDYLPVTTAMWRQAADLWATARREGRPTAPDPALDGDVLLAAQALALGADGEVVIATTNPRHLRRYAPASSWEEIT